MTEKYILGVKVNFGMTFDEVVSRVAGLLEDGASHYISTTNPEFVMAAQKDKEFKDVINKADLSVPDAAGVLYAGVYQDNLVNLKRNWLFPLKAFISGLSLGSEVFRVSNKSGVSSKERIGERISGVELTERLCKFAAENNRTVFLLGGRLKDKWGRVSKSDIELSELTANKLLEKYPSLKIVGYSSVFSPKPADDEPTLAYIKDCMKEHNLTSIDFLFVAYGHPGQEKWISRNCSKVPAKVSIGVGGTFDYICQTQKRSPKTYIDMNLEWLYKLFTQPWRLKRIVKAFPLFPIKVYMTSLRTS